jgi:hypothetical protein
LVRQTYGGINDYKKHFMDMLPAFKDKRYFKINGKLVFTIYKPEKIPDTKIFFTTWNLLAKENSLPNFYFIGCTVDKYQINKILNEGYDLVNLSMLNYVFNTKYNKISMIKNYILNKLKIKLNIVEYSKAIKILNDCANKSEKVAPTIIPNWDHSPRSGRFGQILINSTPKLFKNHVLNILDAVKEKESKIVFIKSWNEWGEGNYLEPDLKYGKQYIEILANCLKLLYKDG